MFRMGTMKNASGAQQLALLSDVSSIPTVSVRFQLSQDTRKIGRRHVAEIRQMLAEYSTFLMVMIWTGVSYIPQNTPEYIPRRLVIEATTSPNSMEAWSTITRLNELDDWHIGAAVVPAIVITVLFYFDHNVSAQLAQVCVFRNFFSL